MSWRTAIGLLMLCVSTSCRGTHEALASTHLAVADSPAIGRYVTDESGRPLYALDKDDRNTSRCYDECAVSWPPALGSPLESREPAIHSNVIGSLTRHDGTRQLTYGGWPLYYRRLHNEQGLERSITDRWGTWSLLFPHGERVVP
jgi:predicted lipoprotein with Yx(FWY)xxD motif